MRVNTLKQKLARRAKPVFGAMIHAFPAPSIVEHARYMGFDWVLIDNEHGLHHSRYGRGHDPGAELTGVARHCAAGRQSSPR
jgi:hypothetical protein